MRLPDKYKLSPFDPDDPGDARSEAAQQILASSFLEAADRVEAKTDEDLVDILGGLLLGLVRVMAAHVETSDEAHAEIRANLIQATPWAVDAMRAIKDLPPLPEA